MKRLNVGAVRRQFWSAKPHHVEIAVEMSERQRVVHESRADMVDNLLRGRQPSRKLEPLMKRVTITRESPAGKRLRARCKGEETSLSPAASARGTLLPFGSSPSLQSNGWRTDGQMLPLPKREREGFRRTNLSDC